MYLPSFFSPSFTALTLLWNLKQQKIVTEHNNNVPHAVLTYLLPNNLLLKGLLLICTYRFNAMHWKIKSVLTTNCICLSESKHSKIQPITVDSASYLALLKHFHVLILPNYSTPTTVLKLFLQYNTEHNTQLQSQFRNIYHALNLVRPRTRVQPKSLRKICKNSTPQIGRSSFLSHPFQFTDH